jgi:hypothetical protein
LPCSSSIISAANPQVENLVIDQSTSAPATTNVNVTIDALTNRHSISTYVYGGAYPKDGPTISDSGLTVVRWGGNATSRYNWKTFTINSPHRATPSGKIGREDGTLKV